MSTQKGKQQNEAMIAIHEEHVKRLFKKLNILDINKDSNLVRKPKIVSVQTMKNFKMTSHL